MFELKTNWLVMIMIFPVLNIAASELRDPTRPPDFSDAGFEQPAVNKAVSAYRLSMTKTGGETDIAVINGKSIRTGEIVDGAKVVAIRAGEADVMLGGEKHLLKVQRSAVKMSVGDRKRTRKLEIPQLPSSQYPENEK